MKAKQRLQSIRVGINMFEAAMQQKKINIIAEKDSESIKKTEAEINQEAESMEELEAILAKETSHLQWLKHSFCFMVLAS